MLRSSSYETRRRLKNFGGSAPLIDVVKSTELATPLLSAVYISSARFDGEEEILEVLRVSRKNNQLANITGLLAYKEGSFLQILEGPQGALTETLERISKDKRHSGMITLAKRELKERMFPDWSMAYQAMTALSPEEGALCSTLLDGNSLEKSFQAKQDMCYTLLQSFRRNMRFR